MLDIYKESHILASHSKDAKNLRQTEILKVSREKKIHYLLKEQ